jgi:hypothetical protein
MPTYPVKNLKTGEEKELHMSMKDYMTGIKTGQKDVLVQVKLVIGAPKWQRPILDGQIS